MLFSRIRKWICTIELHYPHLTIQEFSSARLTKEWKRQAVDRSTTRFPSFNGIRIQLVLMLRYSFSSPTLVNFTLLMVQFVWQFCENLRTSMKIWELICLEIVRTSKKTWELVCLEIVLSDNTSSFLIKQSQRTLDNLIWNTIFFTELFSYFLKSQS